MDKIKLQMALDGAVEDLAVYEDEERKTLQLIELAQNESRAAAEMMELKRLELIRDAIRRIKTAIDVIIKERAK